MPDEFERYAVYWVPGRNDGLTRFGSSWMGWCAEMGEPRPRHAAEGLSADIAAVTREVALHGFHGVIRAPFRLRPGRCRWSVERALELAADQLVATPLPPFELAVIGGRLALVPDRPDTALALAVGRVEAAIRPLADDCSATPRAAAGPQAAMGRLRQLPASPAHRFHLPLTDRIDLGAAFSIRDEIALRLEPLLGAPRQFADLALMGDPGGSRPFRVLQRFELHDTLARPASEALPCIGPWTLVPMPHRPEKADIAV
jgi:hypothetical protein